MPSYFSALFVLALSGALHGAPHRSRLHANPNITILGIAEDGQGMLCLAAEDGLYRFDGVHYHKIPGLPFQQVRFVGVTKDDAVWMAGPQGVARYDGQFRIINSDAVVSFAALPDRILFTPRNDLFRVGLDGVVINLPFRVQSRPFAIDESGALWRVAAPGRAVCRHSPDELWQPRVPGSAGCFQLPESQHFNYALPDERGRIWVANDKKAVRYENGRQVAAVERLSGGEQWRPAPLVLGRNKQVWFIGETVYGLSPEVSFSASEEDRRFLPTAGHQSRDGRLWVAARGKGLTEWTTDQSWRRWFAEDFSRQPLVSVFREGRAIIAATADALYRLEDDRWLRLPSDRPRYTHRLAEQDGTFLAAVRYGRLARLSDSDAALLEYLSPPLKSGGAFSKIVRDKTGRLWASSTEGLFSLENARSAARPVAVELPEHTADDPRIYDMKSDSEGRIWAGYAAGLAWLDDSGKWIRLSTDRPIEGVRAFAFDGSGNGDDIWIAYRKKGLSRLRRDGGTWRVTDYPAGNSRAAADTRFLERDSRGWIWRGTMDGVYVSSGRIEPAQWLHLSRRNGLSFDRFADAGFFEDSDASIWLAGEGVSHIRPDPAWFAAPSGAPPRISRIVVDETEFLRPEEMGRTHAKKSLRIDIGSMLTSPFRDYPLLYNLASDHSPEISPFRPTSGALEFRDLERGNYTLSVKYNGDGGPALTYAFRMGAPVLWPWAWSFALALAAFGWRLRNTRSAMKAAYWVSKGWFLLRQRGALRADGPAWQRAVNQSGKTLAGRFLLKERISSSEFSCVYDALDTREHSRAAVKMFRRRKDRKSAERFAMEIAILKSADHPGVVRIVDWWTNPNGDLCLAMPFLEGPTLRSALRSGPFEPRRAASILHQLGSALGEIHARGIVHRDLKPENILIADAGAPREQAVIIDFGAAAFRTDEDGLATTDTVTGTFHYLAPERLTGRYAPASDIYSMAVIALEILSGKRLFDLRVLPASASFQEELARELGPSLGDAAASAASILRSAFDHDPDGRPTNAPLWAESIASAIGGQDDLPK